MSAHGDSSAAVGGAISGMMWMFLIIVGIAMIPVILMALVFIVPTVFIFICAFKGEQWLEEDKELRMKEAMKETRGEK